MARIGILHPGEMGAWVATAVRAAGHDVLWASEGRSPDTRRRAEDAGLVDAGGTAALAATAEAIVSVCPPAAARQVASAAVAAGFAGLWVDANAVAPATARDVEAVVTAAGGTMVDGGIVGGPGEVTGATRLYLSGEQAASVAGWFTTGLPEPVVVDGPVGAASSVKVGFAGYTKGSAALLLAMRAYARSEGVEDEVLDAWDHALGGMHERSDRIASTIHRKAWRFAGEMTEQADALAGAGLPSGFHLAAAALYEALEDLKEHPAPLAPDIALDRLLGEG